MFSAECTAISTSEDCCSSTGYLCGHDQGNCKTDDDCKGALTCQDTCPEGFPNGYKCCHNSGKFILTHLSIVLLLTTYIKCLLHSSKISIVKRTASNLAISNLPKK